MSNITWTQPSQFRALLVQPARQGEASGDSAVRSIPVSAGEWRDPPAHPRTTRATETAIDRLIGLFAPPNGPALSCAAQRPPSTARGRLYAARRHRATMPRRWAASAAAPWAAPRSAARPPVAWPAVKVRHGHDENSLRLDAIEQPVGKPWNEHPPEPMTKGATALRVFENPPIGALNRGDEIESEVLRLVLVVSSGREEFRLGLWMELDASHRSVERAFSKTWSAGTPDTFPDSSSSSLRSASCSQSFSASGSVS